MKEVEDHDVLFVQPKCLNGFEIVYVLNPSLEMGPRQANGFQGFNLSSFAVYTARSGSYLLTWVGRTVASSRIGQDQTSTRNTDPRWCILVTSLCTLKILSVYLDLIQSCDFPSETRCCIALSHFIISIQQLPGISYVNWILNPVSLAIMIGDWLVQNLGHRRSLYRDLSERSSPLKICIFLIILVPDIYQHVLLLLKCASFRSAMSMGERNTSQLYFTKRSCQKIKVLNKGSHYIRVGQGTVPEIA